jgi:hypothetical protein
MPVGACGIHHPRWIKRRRILEHFQADEELEVWVFIDLLDLLFIREPEPGLDNQGTRYHAKGFCWCSKGYAELRRVVVLQFNHGMSSAI